MRVVSKIDMKPIITKIRETDVFKPSENGGKAEMDREKLGVLGAEVFAELLPQLGKVADDLPPLVAAYKGMSIEEAKKLDALETLSELAHDEAVKNFFGHLFRRKNQPKH